MLYSEQQFLGFLLAMLEMLYFLQQSSLFSFEMANLGWNYCIKYNIGEDNAT
ncbi:hypothetical protein QFZ80_004329 [Paenibacillus sp. V4I7]|nr:hypothetical protein [Paenibacillus sp. V4I7]